MDTIYLGTVANGSVSTPVLDTDPWGTVAAFITPDGKRVAFQLPVTIEARTINAQTPDQA